MLASGLSLETEIVELGEAGMSLSEFVDGVTNATRRLTRTFLETPVYVDPPDVHCKSIDAVTHSNLQRFLRRCLKDELEAMCEHISFEQYNGFTVALHRRKVDDYYGCSAFRGNFTSAEDLSTAIEDARGTTLEKDIISTEFYPLPDTAELNARALINELLAEKKK